MNPIISGVLNGFAFCVRWVSPEYYWHRDISAPNQVVCATQVIGDASRYGLGGKRRGASVGCRGVVIVAVAIPFAGLQGVLEDVVGDGSSGGFAEIVVEGPVDAHVDS